MVKFTRRNAIQLSSAVLPSVGAGCLSHWSSTRPNSNCETRSPAKAPSRDRWPMKGYGPTNASYTPHSSGRKDAPPVEEIGQIKLGNGGLAYGDNVLYIGSLGENAGRIYALESQTGQEVWSTETKHPTSASPAIDSTTVYTVTGQDECNSGSGKGFLHAVARTDGSEKWRADLGGLARSAPIVAGNHVYVSRTSLTDSWLFSFDTETGEKIWGFDAGDHFPGWPAVTTDRIYVVARDQQLYSIDRKSGTIQWKFSGDAINHTPVSAPTVVDGVVYQGSYSGVIAINACTGEHIWNVGPSVNPMNGRGVLPGVSVGNGALYASFVRDDDEPGLHVAALKLDSGNQRWITNITPSTFYMSKPLVTDDMVYVGLSRPNSGVQALNKENGTVRWTVDDGGRQPIIANEKLYTADETNIYSYSLTP